MKRVRFSLAGTMVLLMTMAALPASADPSARGRGGFQPFLTKDRTTVNFSAGLRRDELQWSVSADEDRSVTPNILSELTWEDVNILEAEAEVRHLKPMGNRIFRGALQLEGSVHGGYGLSGNVQDSDYLGDNRTQEFSRATADADTGYTFGTQAAIGYRFNVAQRVRRGDYSFLTLAPLVGYGWDHARFKLEGVQVNPPPVGDPPVLDSHYNTNWYGPFVGMELEWEKNRHMLSLRGEYHHLDYYADAVWNLRNDLAQDPSFEQEGEGSGKKLALKYSYAPDSKHEFTVDVSHTDRELTDGRDTIHFSDGTSLSQKRLNRVDHTSQAVRLGMSYNW